MIDRQRYATRLLTALGAMLLLTGDVAVRGQQPAAPAAGGQDIAVTALLATNPTTLRERARAANILARFGRPDLAKSFLKLVIDAKPDEQQLVALAEEFEAAMFTGMATRADLAPEAGQLADMVLTAINKNLQGADRVSGLVGQLADPVPERRSEALTGLLEARGAAVNPLLAVLADPSRAAEQPAARAVLARLGSDAVGPMIGTLESDDPKLVAQAIRVLGAMNAHEATVYLLVGYASKKSDPEVRKAAAAALARLTGEALTAHNAAQILAQHARECFDGLWPLRTDHEGLAQVWTWDAAKKKAVVRELPADDVSRLIAARLAREAYAVAPNDPRIRLLYLATMLESAVHENGLGKPLPMDGGTPAARAAVFGVETLNAVLEFSMDHGHGAAATAAAEILGRIAQAEEVLRMGIRPAPLVLATRSPDRRLRLAAAQAILRLQPSGPFPGSSYVPEALEFFAATSGARRALVAGPNSEAIMALAGYLVPLGYEVDHATSGREVIQKAIGSPDYELVIVDAGLGRPAADLMLQQLRRDGRTARLPVAILARAGQLDRATRFARHDPLAMAFSRPHTTEAAHWQIDRLMAPVRRGMVPFAQRQRQAAEAVALLAELGATSPRIYNLQRVEETMLGALYLPELGVKAAAILAGLGTPQSQTALVNLASRTTQPLDVRKAATQAFGQSTRRFGILLRTDQIRRQYDRYNASAEEDAATQKILGLILDGIEAPTRVAVQVKHEEVGPERKPEAKQ